MLHIRLQYNDKIIREVRSADIAQDIEIGRSSSCAWRTPLEDVVISSRHAVLALKGHDVWLHDKGSKNGTWLHGKRIEQRKLKAGDRITMGLCVLIVEEDQEKTAGKIVPEVVVLTGKQRNQRKPIHGAQFTIGSDPKADLLFLDDLVSRNHAIILRKEDGGFWLKDLGSTNGTKVNDVPLRAEQERLLKDGDRVAVAHMEFVFHDGTGPRDEGQALRRLGIVAAAALIAAGAYFCWQGVRPSASECIQAAQQLAQKARFAEALKKLDDAVDRRGYRGPVKTEAESKRRQIAGWAATSKQWQEAQDCLKSKKWSEAAPELGRLMSLPTDFWGWDDGPAVQKHARNVKRLLDAFAAANPDNVTRPDILLKNLKDISQALTAAIKDMESQKELEGLRNAAEERLKVLNDQIETYRRLDDALKDLERWQPPPDVDKVLQVVESIVKNSDGALRQRAEMVLQPLRLLATAYSNLNKAAQLVSDMHFKEAVDYKVDLPTPDECIIDGRLSALRTNLENAYANLKRQTQTAEALVSALIKRVEAADAVPSEMRFWGDLANMEKVFSCDSLKGPFPRRTRAEPQGEYDRAVCVEQFYASLRSIADQQPDNYTKAPFECMLAESVRTVVAAKKVAGFFADPEHQWLLSGQLARWDQSAKRTLAMRDKTTAAMLDIARQSSGRKAVIAAGIAWRLMDKPEKERIGDQTFREWLAVRLASVRRDVETLDREREAASFAERIALRNRILEAGLPGDPIVNRMWIEKSESGTDSKNRLP